MDVKTYGVTFTANFLDRMDEKEVREIINTGLKVLNWGNVNFDISEVK